MLARVLAPVVCVAALVGAGGAGAAETGRFTFHGTVTSVTDGDTLRVRMRDGTVEAVRLIGIDAPERGACFASKAAAVARRLTHGKRVTLKGDATQDTRDSYGRLLAYVWLPGGQDLGYQLLTRGAAKTYVYRRPFQRLGAYRAAEAFGRRVAPSVWTCARPAAPQPVGSPSRCDPSYPDVCIPPYDRVGDLDCADVSHSDFRVVGRDPHGFDGDRDGVGCEG